VPRDLCEKLRQQRIKFSFHKEIEEVISKADVLYMTRIQEERFTNPLELKQIKNRFILTPEHLQGNIKENLQILHPLPRINEISPEIDDSKHASYFEQAENGLYIRQALLSLVLGNQPTMS
jgi:aspartate carbamoyltransferase catalytic subunit